MTESFVSFVVLGFNGGQALERCVASVVAQDDGPIQCVVVDNGSTDSAIEHASARFPQVQVIRNGRNLGFGGGMNIGIAASQGDAVVCVNQDAVLAPTFAGVVRRVLAEDSRIGAVGGTVLRYDDRGPAQTFDAGGYMLRRRMAVGRMISLPHGRMDVFGLGGCCPAFRRAMLEDIRLPDGGYFDASYFLYFEDFDLFFRAHLRGWRVLYLADVLAWHRGSMSSGGARRFYQKALWVQRLHLRNRYWTILKDCPLGFLGAILPWVAVSELLLWPFLLLRSPRSLGVVVLAWRDVLAAASDLRCKRRAIQARRTVPSSELWRLVGSL